MLPLRFAYAAGAPVPPSSLSDDEERAEPHDQLPGGQGVSSAPLCLLSADHLTLGKLHPQRLPSLSAAQAGLGQAAAASR